VPVRKLTESRKNRSCQLGPAFAPAILEYLATGTCLIALPEAKLPSTTKL
jgi:hypothetical protein